MFQAEDGIRDLVRSRGLGDVYKRQAQVIGAKPVFVEMDFDDKGFSLDIGKIERLINPRCLLYTSDAADERSSVDLGGRRIIKKKKEYTLYRCAYRKERVS